VGKTNEREIYYSVSGKYITTAITHFQPREKPLTAPKICLKLSASISMPSPYCCMSHPEILHLEIRVNSLFYRLFCTSQQQQKQPQKLCLAFLDFCSLFLLLYGLYRSVQYDLQQQKINSTLKQKFLLGICALALLENLPFLLPSFLSQAYSKISQAPSLNCLAHYPMHSFINLKMTFSLQSVFSPSPTLNPKAKI
jgi:hypothetical protein